MECYPGDHWGNSIPGLGPYQGILTVPVISSQPVLQSVLSEGSKMSSGKFLWEESELMDEDHSCCRCVPWYIQTPLLLSGPVETRSIKFQIPTQIEIWNEYAIQMVIPLATTMDPDSSLRVSN
jgi:hypothetical protein